ncbi:competence protein CoiA family protein [Sphingomicrobium nitratireducens]|uniref:competence protein CoiA family protein n=1 Tax=Sphingomicrobium nitratireducens TaxID=2964666 RepID=UPI003B846A2C
MPEINPLGLTVGGGDHEPLMVVAKGTDGNDRWIDEVPRGAACSCVCPKCHNPVIARQGQIRAWSFAHASFSECSGGTETLAHRFAKDVIKDAGGLHIASVDADGWGKLHDKFVLLDDIRLEHRIDGYRADLVGSSRGHDLIIEVKVTHACSVEKVEAYRLTGVSVLEIDLARYRNKTEHELRQAVLKNAPREWLCLSGGRDIPKRSASLGWRELQVISRCARDGRPARISARDWEQMTPLQRVNAIDPDGRQAIRSRGYRGR